MTKQGGFPVLVPSPVKRAKVPLKTVPVPTLSDVSRHPEVPYPVFTPKSILTTNDTTPTEIFGKSLATTKPPALKRSLPRTQGKVYLNPSSPAVDSIQLRNDRLGTLVRQLTSAYSSSQSWDSFVNELRGPSYLAAELEQVQHPATPLLLDWRDKGVPVRTTSEPWSESQKDACILRGCHKSAKDHSRFLREEMAEFVESKFWAVLPYSVIRHLPLMLSPAAVKDERDRKPRLIIDHSWPWLGWPSVNDVTIPHAPPEAMQFGRALERILFDVRHANPKFGPVRLAKHDLKDGFYRMFFEPQGCLRLAVVLPRYEGEEQLIAIPLACTMGWTQSPPTFSTMSETTCDIANMAIRKGDKPESMHRLEPMAATMDDLSPSMKPRPIPDDELQANKTLQSVPGVHRLSTHEAPQAPPSNMPFARPVGTTDVFVDDFIQLAQGGTKRMRRIRHCLLEAIDQVLAQPGDEAHRNEAVSLKKLMKGDGSWTTRKIILGWIIDTLRQTIELPAHRKETLAAIFTDLAGRNRISHKTYLSYLGKLRFVSMAIPGSAGLFGALQLALNKAKGNRIRVTSSLRHHISAFAALAADLSNRPTHLAEIVPQSPSLLGTTDAARAGMGGVYFDPSEQGYVWRYPFPHDVQKDLVSTDNPSGRTTNSDLEHTGLLAQVSLMGVTHDIRYATVSNGSDNVAAVSRVRKGAVTSDGPSAHLCNYACMHQRQNRYYHHAYYVPGPANVMSDDASRLQHLTDEEFLSHFEQAYPQSKPWKLLHLPNDIASKLISALRSKSPPLPTLPSDERPPTKSLESGATSANNSESPLPSMACRPSKSSATSSSLDSAIAKEAKRVKLSDIRQYATPYKPSARGFPTWVSQIQDGTRQQESSIPYWMLSTSPWNAPTTRNPGPTQPTSSSSEDCMTASTPNMPCRESSTNMSSTSSSSPSTGCCDQPNTSARLTRNPEAKRFGSVTSPSPSVVKYTPPRQHLCMTKRTWQQSKLPHSRLPTKRMLSKANK